MKEQTAQRWAGAADIQQREAAWYFNQSITSLEFSLDSTINAIIKAETQE